MLSSPRTAITATLSADPTIEAGKVAEAVSAAEDAINGRQVVEVPALIRRKAVAQRLGVTPQRVDQIAASAGLVRVYRRGSKRAIGFTRASVESMMKGERL